MDPWGSNQDADENSGVHGFRDDTGFIELRLPHARIEVWIGFAG